MPGDANRDRAVDFQDLVLLAQNYNTTGRSWSQGDFTGDGVVDFDDLVKLAQSYNTSLPGTPAPAAALNFQAALDLAFAPAAPTQAPAPPKPGGIPKPQPVVVKQPQPVAGRTPSLATAARLPAPKAVIAPVIAPALPAGVFGVKPIKRLKATGELFA